MQKDIQAGHAPENIPPDQAMLDSATRTLRSQLRQRHSSIPFHWSASSLTGREIIDINTVYPLVQGWIGMDVSIAESLVKSAFYLQSRNGSFASRYSPAGTPFTKEAPWPLLLQATRTVWKAGGNNSFMESLLPRLYLYADWICYYFDPSGRELPKWQSAEEALIPDKFNPDCATPDLTILLLCELEALKAIEREWPDIIDDSIDFQPHIDRFKKLIQEFFWNNNKSQLETIDTNLNATIATPIFYTTLVPMSRSISPEIKLQAKPRLLKALNNFTNQELWPRGDTFQINSVYAFLTLAAAEGAGIQAECDQFDRQLWNTLARHYHHTGSLPENLSTAIHEQESFDRKVPATSPAIVSALLVHIAERISNSQKEGSRVIWLVKKLNRHPAMTVSVPAVLAGMLVLVATILTITRQQPTGPRMETSIALADRYYQTGDYEAALRICNQYIENSDYMMLPKMMKAKILYHMEQYDEAEQVYRSLLEQEGYHPYARLNLGLLLYRKGEYQAAIANYQEFIDKFGEDSPAAAKRAALAIRLIENHPDLK